MKQTTTLAVGGRNVSNNSANSPVLTPCFFKGIELQFLSLSSAPSNAYYINLVTCCLINALLTCSTIILNGLTVLAYWKSSQLRKKTCYFLVMLLSLSDLATGVFGNSLFTVYLATETMAGDSACSLMVICVLSTSLCGVTSFSIFMVLHFERYLGICHAICHRNYVTKRRSLMASLVVFFFFQLFFKAYFINKNLGSLLFTSLLAVLLLMIIFMYVSIFIGNRKRTDLSCHSNQVRHARKVKFAKACIMIVGASVICFLPLTVHIVIKRKELNIVMFGVWSLTTYYASATINSVIFFWKNRVLRKEGMKIIRQTTRKVLSRRG